MVNTNIQGVVPIDGVGFTAKLKRNYGPGEYRRLSNCRIENGILRNRLNITAYNPNATVTPATSVHPFIGFVDDSVMTVSKTAQHRHRPNNALQVMWSPSNLPIVAHGNSFHKIVGVFEYNSRVYWITWQVNGVNGVTTFHIYHSAHDLGTDAFSATFASLSTNLLFTVSGYGAIFDNFFVYKERLWIVTNMGIYFSKVADPTNFTAPDGGFFRLRDQNINHAFSVRDGIYLLCDSSVHYLTYTTDPNTDSYIREISNSVGGDHGTQYNDTAYMVNAQGIYAITGNTIDLVKDDFDVTFEYGASKLIAWDKYLILLKVDKHAYSTLANIFWPGPFADMGNIIKDGKWGLGHNVFFIDMETGSMHTLDYFDQFSGTTADNPSDRGNVVDLVVNPNKDFYRANGLTIMTNKCSGAADAPGSAHVYRMLFSEFFLYDEVVKTGNGKVRIKPNVDVIFDSYTPDGNEYLMKKFRNLEIMGQFPYTDFEVAIAYDNQAYPALNSGELLINDANAITAAGEARPHFPARLSLNQRARSVSIRFRTRNPLVTMVAPNNIWDQFELSDLRLLWTYTSRGLSTKTPTNVT